MEALPVCAVPGGQAAVADGQRAELNGIEKRWQAASAIRKQLSPLEALAATLQCQQVTYTTSGYAYKSYH